MGERLDAWFRTATDALGVNVGNPWWLLGLLLMIPIATWSLRSLAGLGKARRALAIVARCGVVALIVLALAELQTVQKNDRLTTIFLLDRSESVPANLLQPMTDFVNRSVKQYRRSDDMAGTIVFGKDPKIETPPSLNPSPIMGIENPPDGEYTNLAEAIKLSLAAFPNDAAKRLVIISDGNQNRGNALEQALAAKNLGVRIDVLPINYRYDEDVLVEKVMIPPDVKQGETVNIDVVVRSSGPVKGKLQLIQEANNNPIPVLGEEPVPVELKRGVNVFKIKQTIERPNFYQYRAQFIPEPDSGDKRQMNNEAIGFTQARGSAKVLLIESNRGDHAELVDALTRKGIEVDVKVASKVEEGGIIDSDPLPTNIADLQTYDSVILADVPKDAFTEAQHDLLEKNTHDMGAGLVMLGGPNSFGAGRWMNTSVEKALPVDMQIRSEKFAGKGALVMIMHASEIPQGNDWQAKIAKEALKTLSSYDYAGLIHWTGRESWLFPLQTVGDNRNAMLARITRMTPGDMPDFDPSLRLAMQSLLAKKDAMNRHIIIISDGDPTPPTGAVLRALASNKITVTAVLTAAHGNDPGSTNVMQNIARTTKGRFYNVTNPKALPRIYQKEIRLISRPLIHERPTPWALTFQTPTEPLAGIDSVPGIGGIVLTEFKQNALIEKPIVSKIPPGRSEEGDWPLLTHWTYGLGRSVAFTSDSGRRWAKGWVSWDQYANFWSQIIRWSMRPVDSGNLQVTLRREEGTIKIVAEGTTAKNEFLNFLKIQGVVLRPDLKSDPIELRQTAPGRYEAKIEGAEARGNYFVTLDYRDAGGKTRGRASSGVSVPYSDEYRELRSNPSTLETLASVTSGKTLKWAERSNGIIDMDQTVLDADVFRRDPGMEPPRSFTDLWPSFLVCAAFLFLFDVAVRRIAPDFDGLKKKIRDQILKLRGLEPVPVSDYMEKLRGRKAEVTEQIDRAKAAVRFEPPPMPVAPIEEIVAMEQGANQANRSATKTSASSGLGLGPTETPQAESYTDRLLKAKQKVWDDRGKKNT